MQRNLPSSDPWFSPLAIKQGLLELENKNNNDFKKKDSVPAVLAALTHYHKQWEMCHKELSNVDTRGTTKVMVRMAEDTLKETVPPSPTTWGECHQLFTGGWDSLLQQGTPGSAPQLQQVKASGGKENEQPIKSGRDPKGQDVPLGRIPNLRPKNRT
eukprot:gene9245-16395_t